MAGKKDRQRKLARERYQRRLDREAQHQQTVRRTTKWVSAAAVLVVLVGVIAVTLVHLGSKKASALPTPSRTPTTAPSSPAASPSPSTAPTPPATEPASSCDYVPAGSAARNVGVPPTKPDSTATYQATIKTNRGDVVINLLNSKATCTVNSFVFLAAKKYFNNTPCHRLTTTGIYVLQCGDPTGTGQGGPGYEFANENTQGASYRVGTVAMANAGPTTNGSEFFLVYKNSPLPPNYTPFGTIVSGLNVLQAVAKAGSDNSTAPGDGHPKEKVTIESVTITKT